MKYNIVMLLTVIGLLGCGESETSSSTDSGENDTLKHSMETDTRSVWGSEPVALTTHLKDTVKIEGDFILFLRPDVERYESFAEKDPHITEVDSDFGAGISGTSDSLKNNERYDRLKMEISVFRYVLIKDCKGGPVVLDRDSINYGYVMNSPGKEFVSSANVHSGNYIGEIEQYFRLRSK